MLAGDIDVDPTTGNVTRQTSPGHYMFYANKATNAQLGFKREAAQTGPNLPLVTTVGAGAEHGLTYIIVVPAVNTHQHNRNP